MCEQDVLNIFVQHSPVEVMTNWNVSQVLGVSDGDVGNAPLAMKMTVFGSLPIKPASPLTCFSKSSIQYPQIQCFDNTVLDTLVDNGHVCMVAMKR